MLSTFLYFKLRKKIPALLHKSIPEIRKKVTNPESRKKLNSWFNSLSRYQKTLFHRFYARIFKNSSEKIEEGTWNVFFAGKEIRMPLRNDSLLLDWDLALAITAHDAEVKETYENFINSKTVKIFFDAGANYGTHSLLFLVHGINTVSFEPISSLKNEFDFYCSVNNINGNMVNAALGEKSGKATLWIPVGEPWESSIVETEMEELKLKYELEKLEVPLITIDEYSFANNLYPDLIKIDTEGNELNVLNGMINVIKTSEPYILFETNKPDQRQPLWEFFRNQNYTIFSIPFHPQKKQKTILQREFLISGTTNYIAVANSKIK